MTIWNVGGRGVRPEPKPHNNQRLYTWRGETFISKESFPIGWII